MSKFVERESDWSKVFQTYGWAEWGNGPHILRPAHLKADRANLGDTQMQIWGGG